MSYILESSLQKMALVKIASTLWSQSDIRVSIAELDVDIALNGNCEPDEKKLWKELVEKVIERVQKLPLPESMQEKISGFIRPMGRQILKWIKYHHSYRFLLHYNWHVRMYIPAEFSWTQNGTIDRKKTAMLLMEDQSVEMSTCCQLAYVYCLDDKAWEIWDSLPENRKEPTQRRLRNLHEVDVIRFWTRVDLEDDWEDEDEDELSSYKSAFLKAVRTDNKVGAEYFLQKCTPNERKLCLSLAFCMSGDAEVLCFVLSQMTEKQLTKVFQLYPNGIEKIFCEWPWVIFAVQTVNQYWHSVNEFWISPLTRLIDSQVSNGYEVAIYRELFKELWKGASKRFGADTCACEDLLERLLDAKDKGSIGFMFQDVSPTRKKEFILSPTGCRISIKLMEENEWELLEFFIRECLLLKREIREYARNIKEIRNEAHATKVDEFFLRLDIESENEESMHVEEKADNSID